MNCVARWLVVLTLLPLAACSPAPQSEAGGEDTRAEDEAAIRALRAAFSEAQEAGDADRIAAFYTDDAILMAAGEESMTGIDDIRAGLAAFNEAYEWSSQEPIEELQVMGDRAFTRTTWSTVRTHKETGAVDEFSGKAVHIYSRQPDGSWKIAIDIFNFDHPMEFDTP